jgi:ATP-dependent helicase/nuclease subunit A
LGKAKISAPSGLTSEQLIAVQQRGVDMAVTAGAGSGKTRTLVARYLALLGEGLTPMQVAAVTFTEKAAREMRSRMRSELHLLSGEAPLEERRLWEDLEAQIDAARIGTIHSLCAEIIRSHPVEAQVDPQFTVAEEGQAAVWRSDAVANALRWAVDRESLEVVFRYFAINRLEVLLNHLATRRLDFPPNANEVERQSRTAIETASKHFLCDPLVKGVIEDLTTMTVDGTLDEDQTAQVLPILQDWEMAQSDNPFKAAEALFRMRREHGQLPGKRGSVKLAVQELRDRYSETLNPWLGGEKKSDYPPDMMLEADYPAVLVGLVELFQAVIERYKGYLNELQALDFDDLESAALDVLRQSQPREYWQSEIQSVLVDEFQDTNRRQREIIDHLCSNQSGRLFVVGDARQSIYRFRGADVTVFRKLQRDIERRGGQVLNLNTTFRAHEGLLKGINDLVEPIMGSDPRPEQPYWVPFEPLRPHRLQPREGIEDPFIEFVLGDGANANEGRRTAATALARRLNDLHSEGQIANWQDVTLLFRASTAFPYYEDAFEAFDIPSVTVAGRGFFDRPEVRDLLNMMKALADPWDDLAYVGLLRSPAVGVSDAGIFRLRWKDGQSRSLRKAMAGDLDGLDDSDQIACRSAHTLVEQLEPQVGRTSVAELLKQIVDLTGYRAVLTAAPNRLWRNLDKLIIDAQKSKIIHIHEYLEYLSSLRDVGAREGEAVVEAGDSVRLMTIHKSKGLEFNMVVLADAGGALGNRWSMAYLLPEIGLAVQPSRVESKPLAQRLSAWLDRDQENAEDSRLLYVATTRAREKLLISGHLTAGKSGYRAYGWLKEMLTAMDIPPDEVIDMGWGDRVIQLRSGSEAAVFIQANRDIQGSSNDASQMETKEWPERDAMPLFSPLRDVMTKEVDTVERRQDWRVTGEEIKTPEVVTGSLVHEALQRWLFPENPHFVEQMEAAALRHGLIALHQRRRAVGDAQRMLTALRIHPLWEEINTAVERRHELPYALRLEDGTYDNGFMDLLYGSAENGWTVLDFKTDELSSHAAVDEAIRRHTAQMRRYGRAVQRILNQSPKLKLCFLNTNLGVQVQIVSM